MSKRTWVMLGGGVPIIGLLALLAWASINTGGNPGGMATNSDLVEYEIDAETARNFNQDLIGGGSLKLSDYQGQVVMVDFWESWCQHCRVEAPILA